MNSNKYNKLRMFLLKFIANMHSLIRKESFSEHQVCGTECV